MTTIADGDIIKPCIVPNIQRLVEQGFLYLDGKLREVREIHQTIKGMQIELFPHIVQTNKSRWQTVTT